MENTRIVIVHNGEDVEVLINDLEAETKTLMEMHSCFVTMLLHKLTESGISPEEASEIVGRSDEAAIKEFVKELIYV